MIYTKQILITLCSVLFLVTTTIAQDNGFENTSSESKFKLRAIAELGYLSVLDHRVQFSNSGTKIDYVKDGGQNNLFPVQRFSLEVDFNPKNTIIFLYQPLELKTQSLLNRDLIVDDLVFPAQTGVNFLYGFSFYRISYLRELMTKNKKSSFAVGLTIQIRNANIAFESIDGTLFRNNSDIGIVPAFKIRMSTNLNEWVYLELEADGIYAPVSYLNGSDNEIVGAILDASTRVGYRLNNNMNAFLNLRYLGGGAVGTNPDSTGPGDGYVDNWLHFLTVTCGAVYTF